MVLNQTKSIDVRAFIICSNRLSRQSVEDTGLAKI